MMKRCITELPLLNYCDVITCCCVWSYSCRRRRQYSYCRCDVTLVLPLMLLLTSSSILPLAGATEHQPPSIRRRERKHVTSYYCLSSDV